MRICAFTDNVDRAMNKAYVLRSTGNGLQKPLELDNSESCKQSLFTSRVECARDSSTVDEEIVNLPSLNRTRGDYQATAFRVFRASDILSARDESNPDSCGDILFRMMTD